jgi:PTH1 family peptidyl-tRNA hydrolase
MGHLGSGEFLRLRIGIGHPGDASQVVDYVLSRASREDETLIEEAIDEAIEVFPKVLEGDLERAMTVLHSRK